MRQRGQQPQRVVTLDRLQVAADSFKSASPLMVVSGAQNGKSVPNSSCDIGTMSSTASQRAGLMTPTTST